MMLLLSTRGYIIRIAFYGVKLKRTKKYDMMHRLNATIPNHFSPGHIYILTLADLSSTFPTFFLSRERECVCFYFVCAIDDVSCCTFIIYHFVHFFLFLSLYSVVVFGAMRSSILYMHR